METVKNYFKNDLFAAHNDIELVSVSAGYAKARMILKPHHLNGYKTVHGGALFALADFAFAAASNSHGTVAVGISANMNFIKAATTGTLWAEAREVSKNSKLGCYAVEVRNDQSELIAQFQGMVYRKNEPISAFVGQ